MKKDLVYIVQGGIGNQVMRTALLPEMREKFGEIYVIAPYADIFEMNDVDGAFAQAPNSLYEQLIKDNEDVEVVAENPYNNSDFIKKQIHFNDAVRDLFGLPRKGTETCMSENPILPVAEKHPEVVEDVKRFLDQQKKHKFVLIQNTGGQSPLDPNSQIQGPEPLVRNYKWMEELVAKLQEKYKGYTFIQYKLPNEKLIDGCVSIERPYLWYRVLGEVLAEDKDNFAVVIDSSLQHILAGTGLNTTVLWGETRPEHFGHFCHNNVDFAKNDLTKCEPYFQLFQNKPAVIRFKKPDELLEEILPLLPEVKENK
jgi:hypothetical protein